MDQLWAPWRLSYVATAEPPKPGDACFLCDGLRGQNDKVHLIVQRQRHTLVVLNRFPYNNGHLLIAPHAHKAELSALSNDEMLEGLQVIQHMMQLLKELMQPDGFNVGLNLGRAAGAGLPGHLHWHLVPRWEGDTNFMPALNDTKVIVQSLDSLYDLLKERLPE